PRPSFAAPPTSQFSTVPNEAALNEEYVEPPSAPTGLAGWVDRNKALAISLAAGIVGVIMVVIWASWPQKPKNGNTAQANPPTTPEVTHPAPTVNTNTTKVAATTAPATIPQVTHVPVVAPPPVDNGYDPRMDKAQR